MAATSAHLSAVLCMALAALAGSACSNAHQITCGNISKDTCERVVLPAIKAGPKEAWAKYDLNMRYFTKFDCEYWSPLRPIAGQNVPEVHVVYDSCKQQAWINRWPTL